MHTPEQAKSLWCPHVRIARHEVINETPENFIVAGVNSDALGGSRIPKSCRCIADQCAMWREVVQLHAAGEPPPAPRGYCGLAGRPQ